MAKVYLHAGLPKTGTTTIQNWLAEHASTLLERGIFTFRRSELGHRLAIESIEIARRKAKPDIVEIAKCDLGEAVTLLRQAAHDETIGSIVISSEYFSLANPARVRQLLTEIGLTDVTVVILLRRQDRIIESGHNQDVRAMGVTEPIERAAYHSAFDWHLLASSWANAFSPEALLLLRYEALTETGGSILLGFFAALDPKLSALALELPPADERSNPSLRAGLLEFKRLANKAGIERIGETLDRASALGLGGPPFRMDRGLARAFLEAYRESNRKLAKEFLEHDGELFDESDLSASLPQRGADYTGQLPLETVAQLLAFQMQNERDRAHGENKRFTKYAIGIEKLTLEVEQLGRKLAEARGPGENAALGSELRSLRLQLQDLGNEMQQKLEAMRTETDLAIGSAAEDFRRLLQAVVAEQQAYTQTETEETRQLLRREVAQLQSIIEELRQETSSPMRLIRRWWRRPRGTP